MSDLRLALRALRRAPGYALVAILTLGLGIGATTAIFSILDGVILRPFGYERPEELVILWERNEPAGLPQFGVAPGNYAEWKASTRSFAGMTAQSARQYTVTGTGEPERIVGARVMGDFFQVLGIAPSLGRAIGPADAAPGANPVAVVSHAFWQSRLGARPDAVGESVQLDGVGHEVIGVAPAGLVGMTQVWVPLQLTPAEAADRGLHFLAVFARLRPGVTLTAAQAELDVVAQRLAAAHPDTNADWEVLPLPLLDAVVGSVRTALYALMGAVVLVLLIACGNVANLSMARGLERGRELAVRLALGANRARLARYLFAEGTVLGLGGAVLGIGIAVVAVQVFSAAVPLNFPRSANITLHWRLLVAAIAAAVLTMPLVGLLPALRTTRVAPGDTLRSGGRAGAGRDARRLQGVLVAGQIALAAVLFVGAGLLIRSFMAVRGIDPGFTARGEMSGQVALPQATYPDDPAQLRFAEQLEERLLGMPGVTGVGLINVLPLSPGAPLEIYTVQGEVVEPGRTPSGFSLAATPEYFTTVGIGVVRGRGFTSGDRAGALPVLVVDETFARRHFADRDPIGQRVTLGGDSEPREIVGVVRPVAQAALDQPARPMMYVPLAQRPPSAVSFVVTTAGEGLGAAAIKEAVWSVDPQLPVQAMQTMSERLDASMGTQRFYTVLAGLFGLLALALGGLGIYGVLAYRVSTQTREIGVRLALGADRGQVLRDVLRQGIRLSATGLVLGLLAAMAGARVLASLLVEVTPRDPLTFGVAAVVFLSAAVAGALVPALRATRVDPLIAIRSDQ